MDTTTTATDTTENGDMEHLHLKVDVNHRPGCGMIDVNSNFGYDMRRSLDEVLKETREAGWTIDLSLSGGPGKVDIYAWRRKVVPVETSDTK